MISISVAVLLSLSLLSILSISDVFAQPDMIPTDNTKPIVPIIRVSVHQDSDVNIDFSVVADDTDDFNQLIITLIPGDILEQGNFTSGAERSDMGLRVTSPIVQFDANFDATPGKYEIFYAVEDRAENIDVNPLSITIEEALIPDTVAPTTSNFSLDVNNGGRVNINFGKIIDDIDSFEQLTITFDTDASTATGGNILEQGSFTAGTNSTDTSPFRVISETVTFTAKLNATPGTYTFQYVAKDEAGNENFGTVTIIIGEDKTAPSTPDIQVYTNPGAIANIDFSVVTDDTDSFDQLIITFDTDDEGYLLGNGTFTEGTNSTDTPPFRVISETVKFTANDNAHLAEYSFSYTVIDRAGFESPSTANINIQTSSRGGGEDWKKAPTFGRSFENTKVQIVENGFVFNGYKLNIVDNWHTEFLKTSSIIGDTNTIDLTVYTDKRLGSVALQLGVPEIGKSSDAETGIFVTLNRNYTNPADYDIVDVTHEQKEPLLDTDRTTVSIKPSKCSSVSKDEKCYTISFEFVVMAPLKHDVITIHATDSDRRTTVTHINEGVEFTGDSLLDPATHTMHIKKTSQEPVEILTLTQQDRRYSTWEDGNGHLWEQNDHGTWYQITYPDHTRQDAPNSVMTRLHSDFAEMITIEQDRAIQIWNSTIITNHVQVND